MTTNDIDIDHDSAGTVCSNALVVHGGRVWFKNSTNVDTKAGRLLYFREWTPMNPIYARASWFNQMVRTGLFEVLIQAISGHAI